MKTILDMIVDTKREELETAVRKVPVSRLESMPVFSRMCQSLKGTLLKEGSSGIIAEFKQKSPSKGIINSTSSAAEVTRGYADAGASGISVLTDYLYFGGSLENLQNVRNANPFIPVLRKDFVVDAYQLYEAKAYGADVVLLIAACLSKGLGEELAGTAAELGLEVLFEIHGEEEIGNIPASADLVGVNNRGLKTMEVNPETSILLAPMIPDRYVKISESGLSRPEVIHSLRTAGYRGFLIGENFMKTSDPAQACREFILKLKEYDPD
jgi:indole-3-glycerol phosphate synthase